MSTRSIGGTLDLEALRMLHRPADPRLLAAEARRLAATGLRPRDIAQALRLPMSEVLSALQAPASTAIPADDRP